MRRKLSAQDKRILNFFKDQIEPKDFSRVLRRLSHTLSYISLSGNPEIQEFQKWNADNFFVINKFAEALEPVLDDK